MPANEAALTLAPSPQTEPIPDQDKPEIDRSKNLESAFLQRYLAEKPAGLSYKEFRYPHWDDNKALYDDAVAFNRLTQRQPVNIPIMRETINTLLAGIDDLPEIRWDNRDSGPAAKDKEIVIGEIWAEAGQRNNFEMVDYTGKKSVQLYGRCIKKHTLAEVKCDDGKMRRMYQVGVLDVYDFLVDPRMTPGNLQSARFCTHVNIKRRLTEILASREYSQEAKQSLIIALDNPQGGDYTHGAVVASAENETWAAKQERLRNLEINDLGSFAGADVEVDLNEHYTEIWDNEKNTYVRYVGVIANGAVVLQVRTLEDAIGFERWPFTSWTDDPDALIFWNLGIADIIRTPNKVLNVFFSQMLENRTLRNYGMMWYDPSDPEFVPSTYTAEPFGMYPAPKVMNDNGKTTKPIQEVLMPIQIPALEESLTDIQFIVNMLERATSATSVKKGVPARGQQTLGEIEALLAESERRTVASAKFYRKEWEESAQMFYDLISGAITSGQSVVYYRKNERGEYVPKEIKRQDWESERGYKITAVSATERDAENTKKIKGLLAAQKVYPNNRKLNAVLQKRLLQLADVTGEEMQEIEREEERQATQAQPTATGPSPEQVKQAQRMVGAGREMQRVMAEMP